LNTGEDRAAFWERAVEAGSVTVGDLVLAVIGSPGRLQEQRLYKVLRFNARYVCLAESPSAIWHWARFLPEAPVHIKLIPLFPDCFEQFEVPLKNPAPPHRVRQWEYEFPNGVEAEVLMDINPPYLSRFKEAPYTVYQKKVMLRKSKNGRFGSRSDLTEDDVARYLERLRIEGKF